MEGYNCFGCCPDNPIGLKMRFYEDGKDVVCLWRPQELYQSWKNTLHGGVQAALIDEIASWVVFRKFQTSGVTSNMEVQYKKPVALNQSHITLRARVVRQRRQVIDIEVELFNAEGELCSKGLCIYFLMPKERARDVFGFMEFKTEDEVE